jgi:hypothetical protein
LGENKAIVGVFNGPVVYVNLGIVLIFLARVVVVVKNSNSTYFENIILAVEYRLDLVPRGQFELIS